MKTYKISNIKWDIDFHKFYDRVISMSVLDAAQICGISEVEYILMERIERYEFIKRKFFGEDRSLLYETLLLPNEIILEEKQVGLINKDDVPKVMETIFATGLLSYDFEIKEEEEQ